MSLRVLLYSRVDPADGGGVQAVFRRLAAYLRSGGHTVVQAWRLPDPHRIADDATYTLPLLTRRRGVPTPRSLAGAALAAVRLARALFGCRPDVVNLHYVTAESTYFFLLKPILGYRIVLSVHGSDILHPKPWDAAVLPHVLPRADAITTVSSLTAARVKAFPGVDPGRVRVVPNGVDYAFWSAPIRVPLRQRPPIVVTVGRLKRVKGHDVLLRALRLVRARVPTATVVIIGDGELRAELEGLAAELCVSGAVEFAGQVPADEVRARLGQARCFALPSRSEGSPLALLEAMASGLPAVASRVGGVPDVLSPGAGVLVPPEDPVALAAAISDILLDPAGSAEMSRRARERASAFTAAAADAAYEELLVQGGPRAPRGRTAHDEPAVGQIAPRTSRQHGDC